MFGLMFGAAVSGLVGSPHCAGMCGPFAVACGGSARTFSAWHGGRLAMYGLLGALAGGIGSVLPGPAWLGTTVSAVLIVAFAMVLAGVIPDPKIDSPRVRRWAKTALRDDSLSGRFALGLANGLLPCGLVYAALGIAVAAGSPWWGAAVMIAFGTGTTPVLAAVSLGMRRGMGRSLYRRRIMAGLVLVSGLASVWSRSNHSAQEGASVVAPTHATQESSSE